MPGSESSREQKFDTRDFVIENANPVIRQTDTKMNIFTYLFF